MVPDSSKVPPLALCTMPPLPEITPDMLSVCPDQLPPLTLEPVLLVESVWELRFNEPDHVEPPKFSDGVMVAFPANVTVPEKLVTRPKPTAPLITTLLPIVLGAFVARIAPPVIVTVPVPKTLLLLTFTIPDAIVVPPLYVLAFPSVVVAPSGPLKRRDPAPLITLLIK